MKFSRFCFRPLSGILVSNMMKNYPYLDLNVSFRPLSGILVSNLVYKWNEIARMRFPSPFGDFSF